MKIIMAGRPPQRDVKEKRSHKRDETVDKLEMEDAVRKGWSRISV